MSPSPTPAGPTLVLLHAFPLDHEMWTPQAHALASAAQVVAVDLPGFGRTAAAPFTIDSAADTVVVLDAGRVRATGTHAQLVESDAWYATFARAGRPSDAPPPADVGAEVRPAESEH